MKWDFEKVRPIFDEIHEAYRGIVNSEKVRLEHEYGTAAREFRKLKELHKEWLQRKAMLIVDHAIELERLDEEFKKRFDDILNKESAKSAGNGGVR